MFDTVNFILRCDGGNMMERVAPWLSNVSTKTDALQRESVHGQLCGLDVNAGQDWLSVKNSLSRYYYGSNIDTLTRKDTQLAVERLSDELHQPIREATVARLDVAHSMIMKQPTDCYLYHCGEMARHTRLTEPHGIYYTTKDVRYCLYDKAREVKARNGTIEGVWVDRNVLRYEQRYIHRVARHTRQKEVTAAMLYDEAYYMRIVRQWAAGYRSIKKINTVHINFKAMKTKKDANRMAAAMMIEQCGGYNEFITQLEQNYKLGEITRMQKYYLKQWATEAMAEHTELVARCSEIEELDSKIKQAEMYYR